MDSKDDSVFPGLCDLERWRVCEMGIALARNFLEKCAEAVEHSSPADNDGLRFAFSRAWQDYANHRNVCPNCKALAAMGY